jgi:hypothetical protein
VTAVRGESSVRCHGRHEPCALYDRIAVKGRTIVAASLTPAAYSNGLALALDRQVVMARPEGFEPPTLWSEATCSGPLSYGRADAQGSAGRNALRRAG